MQTIQAHVLDPNHLELKEPIKLAPGSNITVTIVDAPGAENELWYQLSARELAAAYGENEPEYSDRLIKIPNPEFQP